MCYFVSWQRRRQETSESIQLRNEDAEYAGRVPGTKLKRKWMGESGVDEGLIEKVSGKRISAQNKYKGDPRKTVCVKLGDYVKIKSARIVQKGESRFSYPKKVIKICKNAVKLEDGNWWNKERLSLARDVELLNKSLKESTKVNQEARMDPRKDEVLEGPIKKECESMDMKRKSSTRNKRLPTKFRDFVLSV
ncbi:hypothetical protein NDU88_007623 [Pleurodeles waltl]|uniref:Uncharacterized protein n=1 Tax=Pleurodeles waltl TaxID=8319 RepID=A0AAV7VQZ8_PLEWA|nr:hypothetical protein NDU88_007623 [Pleurodeles waltl]